MSSHPTTDYTEPITLSIDTTIPDEIVDTPKVLCAPKATTITFLDWDTVYHTLL
jgi:hypothetical protein